MLQPCSKGLLSLFICHDDETNIIVVLMSEKIQKIAHAHQFQNILQMQHYYSIIFSFFTPEMCEVKEQLPHFVYPKIYGASLI